ncbi:MAG: glycosyltransferase family 4 protein [Chloroflexota bacterium]
MKILFLSRWFPYPPDNGSKLRISNLIRQLAAEHEVFLVSFRPPERIIEPAAEQAAASVCATVDTAPYHGYRSAGIKALLGLLAPRPRSLVAAHSPEFAAQMARRLREHRCDLVVASELDMLPYALAQRDAPILLDDLELGVYRDGLSQNRSVPARLRAWLTWFKLGNYLRRELPRVAACTVVSEQERETVRMIAPAYSRVSVVPNAVDVASYAGCHAEPQPNTLIFSGALSYRANYDGLRWFLAEVFPRVQRAVPDVRLRVTGSTQSIDLAGLPASSAVEYTGYVDDIRPVVAESWVAVVPLLHGSGTRLKILEAMALGTPVVSTSKGAEGLAATPGDDIILHDDPDGFARGVVDLLRSSELRRRLAEGGRRLVQDRYDWQVVGAHVRALAQSASGRSGSESGVHQVRWQTAEHG